ncbi:MAG: response regulator transcription factor, partial [Muribaculaceae bacterium]|nr:response regulator transcription factor [Muribaculaceae bacterium]
MGKRILFVEDEADLILIVAETLRGEGYEVVTAPNGLEGLRIFRSEGADIVVADVMMPLLDGYSMAKEVRKISSTVPLLFLTAKSSIDDIEEGFECGANDYLRKPFELRELIVRIKALLRRFDQYTSDDDKIYIGNY